jgi:sarcosine oxidase subunit alpha
MYPASFWKLYESVIRRFAGLGRAPQQEDPDSYHRVNQHCDVLIVGAGPAGLAAALTAARSGARVIVADEQSEFGGSLLNTRHELDGRAPGEWVSKVVDELAVMDNVMLLPRSTVNGYHDHNFLTIQERCSDHLGDVAPANRPRQQLHRVRAKWVVLATGSHERPLVYGNNDLPGCMLCSAVSTYINRYACVPGNRLVVMTSNDSAYEAALDWHDAGREVVAVVDSRSRVASEHREALRARGITLHTGSAVINVRGSKSVTAVEVAALSGTAVSDVFQLACDTVASSGGWSPAVHLSCHTGSRPVWNEGILGFVPGETVQNQVCAGAIRGAFTTTEALEQGAEAAQSVLRRLGREPVEVALPESKAVPGEPAMALFHIPHTQPTSRAPKQFVDFQNDVTASAIELACREGFQSIEHVKRYTSMGFGTDQGKLGNINGMAIAAAVQGKSMPEVGTTVFRPNYTPVTFGAIVGRDKGELFDPRRYTALHPWHLDQGAVFEDVGLWKRPRYYPRDGETMQQALDRECLATRESVGPAGRLHPGKNRHTGTGCAGVFESGVYQQVARSQGWTMPLRTHVR